MPKVYKAKELLRFFLKQGFLKVSQKGSHIKMKDNSGRTIIIPMHSKDVPYGTFVSIVQQSGLSIKEVIGNLKK